MWAHDYCTVCDKQCAPGSMYCSDSCRLSEAASSLTVSSHSDNVYSTLYTTGRHHSLSSPLLSSCDQSHPLCLTGNCVCADDNDEHTHNNNNQDEHHAEDDEPWLSPALTVSTSPAVSIQESLKIGSYSPSGPVHVPNQFGSHHHGHSHRPLNTPPLSPSMLGPLALPRSKVPDQSTPVVDMFTNTSVNYKRWLSSVV